MIEIRRPEIKLWRLPPEEQRASHVLSMTLRDLEGYLSKFRAALTMFDFCEAQDDAARKVENYELSELINDWQLVAVRDGAMTIWHFGKAMIGAKATLRLCPTIRANVDNTKLKSAGRAFKAYFDKYEQMRHAVAHSGELGTTTDNYEKNSFTGTYSSQTIEMKDVTNCVVRDALHGRQFTTTGFDGEIVSYEISQDTLRNLAQVLSEFYSAFQDS